MSWIAITLQDDEKSALRKLAECEKRDPRAQAALLIRLQLEKLGLLQSPTIPPKTEAINVHN